MHKQTSTVGKLIEEWVGGGVCVCVCVCVWRGGGGVGGEGA